MTPEINTAAQHRAELVDIASELRAQLEELRNTIDEAGNRAGMTIGAEHAPEGRALVSLLGSATSVVDALVARDDKEAAEHVVDSTIRNRQATTALHSRLTELETLPELARSEADRRTVVADLFGGPLISTTQLEVELPASTLASTFTVTVDDSGTVNMANDQYPPGAVDGHGQLAITEALNTLADELYRAADTAYRQAHAA